MEKNMPYKCDQNYCNKQRFMNMNNTLVVPTDLEDDELRQLLGYFQYRAPGISSEQSFVIPETNHQAVYDELFQHKQYEAKEFYQSNKTIKRHIANNHLVGNSICVKCKRFVCRLDNGDETRLNCLLRHIRNSIAHGRIHLLNDRGYYLCFEDINKKGSITARIICNKEDLKSWRKILNKYR